MPVQPPRTRTRITRVVSTLVLAALCPGRPAAAQAPSRIVFHTERYGAIAQIAMVEPDGATFTRLTYTSAYDRCPALSRDGTRIAFESTRTGGINHAFVMNADGSDPHRITGVANEEAHVRWSPDGTQVCCSAVFGGTLAAGGTYDICAANLDGTNVRQLTTDAAHDLAPDWSPDGARILFTSRRDGLSQIYVMNADGSDQHRLIHTSTETFLGRWSPDGTRIAYVTVHPGTSHEVVHVMNADTSGNVAVTDSTFDSDGLDWSPDGSRLVIYSMRDGTPDLYTISPSGTGWQRVTADAPVDYSPGWGPAPLDAQSVLRAEAVGHDVVVHWNASPWSDVVRYDVYRGTTAQAESPTLVAGVTDTTWTDSGVLGTAYYRIRVVRAADRSLYSNEVAVTACARTEVGLVGGANAAGAVSADFDEDGIADLAVVNDATSGTVSVLLGRGSGGVGDGTFADRVTYAAGTMPAAIVTGDFNEDGIADLAVVNDATSGTFSILLGRGNGDVGDGTFAAPTSYATGARPCALTTADVNADGITDLLIVHRSANTVAVALGQGLGGVGNGSFAIANSYSLASTPVAITTGDFNGDDITDLAVVSSAGGQVSILLGQGLGGVGNGTFAAAVRYLAGPGACAIVTGDFDEDGVTDLAVPLGASHSQVAVLRGRGDGTFATRVLYTAGSSPVAIRALDVTGDGVTDLVVANSTGQALGFLPGLATAGIGNGTFGTAVSVPLSTTPASLIVGDFLADGRPDLLTTSLTGANTLSLLADPCGSDASTGIRLLVPDGGQHWAIGATGTISWERGRGVAAVDVAVSRDNGRNWETIATHLTADHFDWVVSEPITASVTGRVRVFDPSAPSRADVSATAFRIGGTTTVDPPVPAHALQLEGASPCPARGALTVAFTLPDDAPARLELLDVAGRTLERRDVGGLGTGRHVVVLGDTGGPGSGVFFVRLSHGDRHLVARTVVLR